DLDRRGVVAANQYRSPRNPEGDAVDDVAVSRVDLDLVDGLGADRDASRSGERLEVGERERTAALHIPLGIEVAQPSLGLADRRLQPCRGRLTHPQRRL